jgi:LmbE family N-acetylglucosaminyl deacetylase
VRLPGRILFVGAHCDDVELIAGGLLARAAFARPRRLGVLVFSDHRGVLDDATAAQARRELAGNLAWLEAESGATITDHTGALLPACRGAFEAQRGEIYAALEQLRDDYDLVVTHARADTNQDHRQVALEAARVFKAHASVLGGEFPNNDLGDFRPSVFVPLAPRELAAKVRLVTAYESQRRNGRPYLDAQVIESLARLRGSQVRVAAAEAYEVGARLIVTGPVG